MRNHILTRILMTAFTQIRRAIIGMSMLLALHFGCEVEIANWITALLFAGGLPWLCSIAIDGVEQWLIYRCLSDALPLPPHGGYTEECGCPEFKPSKDK